MTVYLRGVEMPLPEGESVLWQGNPGRGALAVHAFHARKIAIYFCVLVVLTALFARGEAQPMQFFLTSALWLAVGGAMATAFALTVALLASRTSLYAITERRVVMKIGIALPVVLNIPLHIIDGVGVKKRAGGGGDISLRLANKSRVAFAVLWPHARAWHVRYPEPLLRGLVDVDAVGKILTAALVANVSVAPGVAGTAVAEVAGNTTLPGVGAPGESSAVPPMGTGTPIGIPSALAEPNADRKYATA